MKTKKKTPVKKLPEKRIPEKKVLGKKILIVDDEKDIVTLLQTAFKFAGYETETKYNGEEALDYLRSNEVDLILLDIMMPKLSGVEVAKYIRSLDDLTPIIFLTARDGLEHKIEGLELGGDDYITKPFSLEEVIARVKAVLRRAEEPELEYSPEMVCRDILINTDSMDAYYKGELLNLTETEFKILKYLVTNANIVISKEQILDYAWDYDYNGDINIVETFISTLRKKIDKQNMEVVVETKRGTGYIIRK
jgi:two-component system OmpR family response regulator